MTKINKKQAARLRAALREINSGYTELKQIYIELEKIPVKDDELKKVVLQLYQAKSHCHCIEFHYLWKKFVLVWIR